MPADALAELEPAAEPAKSWGKNTADSAEPEELLELEEPEEPTEQLASAEPEDKELADRSLADRIPADKGSERVGQEPANTDSLADAVRFDLRLERR